MRSVECSIDSLWATVVAERLGHPPETALTLGRFVAGSSARAKARRLGISDEKQEAEERHAPAADIKNPRSKLRGIGGRKEADQKNAASCGEYVPKEIEAPAADGSPARPGDPGGGGGRWHAARGG